jgi:hypothetical protein
MPRFKTSLVEVRGILVWELGQTCEAARNGTQIGPGPLLKLPLNQQKIPKGPQEIPQKKASQSLYAFLIANWRIKV